MARPRHAKARHRRSRSPRVPVAMLAAAAFLLALVGVAVFAHHPRAGPVGFTTPGARPAAHPTPAVPAHPTPAHPTPAGPTPAGPVNPDPDTAPDERLARATTRVEQLLGQLPTNSASIAALDLATGRRYHYQTSTTISTASVVKLDILEALLLQRQDGGRALSPAEVAQATAMIQHSDNDAASALWDTIGRADGLNQANQRLGLRHTVPGDQGFWGLTTSDADDQLSLLRGLLDAGPLQPGSRALALDLMRGVQQDQAWGVSAVADPGTTTPLKNGWLDLDSDQGLWAVGSVGIVTVHGNQVLLAVLTQHNASQVDGINLIHELVTAVAPAVSPGGPGPR